jgi:hypothetical protein
MPLWLGPAATAAYGRLQAGEVESGNGPQEYGQFDEPAWARRCVGASFGTDRRRVGPSWAARLDRLLERLYIPVASAAQVAQSVEQRTENPRVGGSIPPLGTKQIQSLS